MVHILTHLSSKLENVLYLLLNLPHNRIDTTRNVKDKTAMPQADLPDPDIILTDFLRREEFVSDPAGNSSLMSG